VLLEKTRVVLNDIKDECLENVFKRHNRLTRPTRAAIEATDLTMVVPDSFAGSTTGCFVPEGLDVGKLVKSLRDDFGVTLAGGQDQWKGQVVRIAHLGYVDTFDAIITISALEVALKKMRHNITLGKGVSAAPEIPLEGY